MPIDITIPDNDENIEKQIRISKFLIKESIDIILDLESCFSKNPTVRKYIPSKYLIEESILFKNTKYLYELHCGEVYMFITESD